jgi:hypothetical protein
MAIAIAVLGGVAVTLLILGLWPSAVRDKE